MNSFALTSHRLLMLLMLGSALAACVPVPYQRGPEERLVNDEPFPSPMPGTTPPVQSQLGSQILASYSESYALLIGESEYTHGWSDLEAVPGELEQVAEILQSQGFIVEKDFELNSRQLKDRFEKFIDQYGFDEDNRLLFFYSGHGHTHDGKGYIVPVDAADPEFDEKGFLRKAVDMNQILTWARRIKAKHALFLFDSCFSGSVFQAKNLPKIPRQISDAAE